MPSLYTRHILCFAMCKTYFAVVPQWQCTTWGAIDLKAAMLTIVCLSKSRFCFPNSQPKKNRESVFLMVLTPFTGATCTASNWTLHLALSVAACSCFWVNLCSPWLWASRSRFCCLVAFCCYRSSTSKWKRVALLARYWLGKCSWFCSMICMRLQNLVPTMTSS